MAAKLRITNVRIGVVEESLRVDLQFKDTVEVEVTEDKKAKQRTVFSAETHYFIRNLAEAEETDYTHPLPATWRKELDDLLTQLTDGIVDYIP